jgi:hypothetical protein
MRMGLERVPIDPSALAYVRGAVGGDRTSGGDMRHVATMRTF